jgi:hypothetical protein
MMGFWAETGLTSEAEFREGNQSPASGALPFLIPDFDSKPTFFHPPLDDDNTIFLKM